MLLEDSDGPDVGAKGANVPFCGIENSSSASTDASAAAKVKQEADHRGNEPSD